MSRELRKVLPIDNYKIGRAGSFVTACGVVIIFSFATLLFGSSDAQAVPAFARQTGQECSMCHVGSFGPQLTSFGRNFKLNGYVWGNEKKNIQDYLKGFSAMAEGGFEHTDANLTKGPGMQLDPTASPPDNHQARYKANDNVTVDQISLFYGGQLYSNLGMLGQVTYNNATEQVTWDNTDIRYANNFDLAGKNVVYGVTVNNNPSVQDVWQTTPAWGFPYVSSAFLQGPTASLYITQLAGSVTGAGVYGLWDNLIYAEITNYATLPNSAQHAVGITGPDTSDHLSSLAPYWRVALQHDFGPHYVEVGTYGLYADRYPGNVRDYGSDNFQDYAIDATYQFTSANNKHNVSVYAAAVHELQNLSATYASGLSANPTDNLTSLRASASYYYENKYGITVSPFTITGSADPVLYSDSLNGKPDTSGVTIQADYTPTGSQDFWGFPYLNVRYFVQYTAYDKFNGSSSNYDGTGRSAADNNLLFLGMWFAF